MPASKAAAEGLVLAGVGLLHAEGTGNTTGEAAAEVSTPCSSLTVTGNAASALLSKLDPQLVFAPMHDAEASVAASVGLERSKGAGDTTGEAVSNPPCSSVNAIGEVVALPPACDLQLLCGVLLAAERGVPGAVAGLWCGEGAGDTTGEAAVNPLGTSATAIDDLLA